MPAVILRARALIKRLKEFYEFIKKVQNFMKQAGRGGSASRPPSRTPSARPRAGTASMGGPMKITVKFVPNRAGIRALLQSDQVGAALEAAARAVAPPGTVVSRQVGQTRQNIRIADESRDALDREAKTGHLTRALGQVRI